MVKKGQITAIILVVVVAVFIIGFLFFARGSIINKLSKTTNVEQQLATQLSLIEKDIDTCISKESKQALLKLAEQGGTFTRSNTIKYNGREVNVLCQNIPEKEQCMTTPLLTPDVQVELEKQLKTNIEQCIHPEKFTEDSDLDVGQSALNVFIQPENVLISLTYPLTLTKGNVTVKKEDFDQEVNIPLGSILNVANDILIQEATTGSFDPISYTLLHLNKYTIELKKPYPDKVYTIQNEELPAYVFSFAVTGDGRFA